MSRLRALARRIVTPRVDDHAMVAAAPPVPVRDIVRRFWPDARPYRKWIALGIALSVVVPAIATVEIWLFKLVVDDVLVPGNLEPLLWIALAYLALSIVGGGVAFADDYVATWVGERFVLNLRQRVFAHVQLLSGDALDRRRMGDLVARLTGDVSAIEAFVLSAVTEAISAVFRIVFFTAALFYLGWDLALVSLTVAPLFYITARRFSTLVRHAAREKRRRSGSLSSVAEESMANGALVAAYNRQDFERARFKRENEGIVDAELASTRISGLFSPLIDLLELAAAMLVIGMGTFAVADGRLTLGGLLVFLAYLSQLYSPIRELSSLSNTIFAASAGAERVIELLDQEPTVTDRPDARPLGRARGKVELDRVTFTYPGTTVPALSGVSLRLEPGETLALVGPSGAGKSTVAKLLLRFHDPDAGAVRMDGQDLRDLQTRSLRDNIAIVLQETLVFHGTVRENIAFGKPDAAESEIVAAARAAGAHDFIVALDEGYDTVLGQRGRRLSGGQRQRVAIARALVRDAPLVIMDEPSAGLDSDSQEHVLDALRLLMRDRSTLVISHDLLTVRDADRIAVLEDGRVTETGRHEELMALGGTYARLYRRQHDSSPHPPHPDSSPNPPHPRPRPDEAVPAL